MSNRAKREGVASRGRDARVGGADLLRMRQIIHPRGIVRAAFCAAAADEWTESFKTHFQFITRREPRSASWHLDRIMRSMSQTMFTNCITEPDPGGKPRLMITSRIDV